MVQGSITAHGFTRPGGREPMRTGPPRAISRSATVSSGVAGADDDERRVGGRRHDTGFAIGYTLVADLPDHVARAEIPRTPAPRRRRPYLSVILNRGAGTILDIGYVTDPSTHRSVPEMGTAGVATLRPRSAGCCRRPTRICPRAATKEFPPAATAGRDDRLRRSQRLGGTALGGCRRSCSATRSRTRKSDIAFVSSECARIGTSGRCPMSICPRVRGTSRGSCRAPYPSFCRGWE